MPLSFRSALFGVGFLFIIIGAAVGLMASAQLEQAGGVVEALSAGVTSSFFALFSSVLVGIGLSLLAVGALLSASSRSLRAAASFLLSLAGLLVSAAAVNDSQKFNFALLLAFLSGAVFSGGMLVAALAFAFSDLLGQHLGIKKPQR